MNLQHMDYRGLIVCLMCHKICINGVQDKNFPRVGDMAKEANSVFLAIFSGDRPCFLGCQVLFFQSQRGSLVSPALFPGGRPFRYWHTVPEEGVSCTEFPFGTPEACFLHRMPQKMRRVPEEPFFRTECIFRTPGGPLLYRMPTTLPPQHTLPGTNSTPNTKHPTQNKRSPD